MRASEISDCGLKSVSDARRSRSSCHSCSVPLGKAYRAYRGAGRVDVWSASGLLVCQIISVVAEVSIPGFLLTLIRNICMVCSVETDAGN